MPGPLPSTRVQRQRARGGSRSRGLRDLLGRVPSASPCHVDSGPPPPPPSRCRRGGLPEAARRHCHPELGIGLLPHVGLGVAPRPPRGHPGGIVSLMVVYNANKLAKLVKEKKTMQNWLDYYKLKYERDTSKRPTTKVSLWDGIIPAKEHAKFLVHTTNKYKFIDQTMSIRQKTPDL